jgi:hypothetical protein
VEVVEMAQFIRQVAKTLHVFVGIMLVTAATAAPNGDASPSQDCFSKAALQRTLDYAQCSGLPLPLRDQCVIKTEQTYVGAVAACSTTGAGRRAVTIRQNTDAPFTRRLR